MNDTFEQRFLSIMSNTNLNSSVFTLESCTFYKYNIAYKHDWFSVISFLEKSLNKGYVSYIPIEITYKNGKGRGWTVVHRYALTEKAKALLVMEKL